MGLMNFRWKLLSIVVAILLLWQVSKIWLVLDGGTFLGMKAQLQEEESLSSLRPSNEKREQIVHVTVYYEALCPDSRSFFIKQLLPTYQKISKNIRVQAVPYGKATTVKRNDDYEFVCQHGPMECKANMIHACAIDAIKNPTVQLEYLTCMIKNNIEFKQIMESCAKKMNIDSNPIYECFMGKRGKELLAMYGEKTNSLLPRVSFIPTITLDGSSKNQPQILKNLLREVCLLFKVLPEGCLTL